MLVQIDAASSLPYQKPLHNLADYLIGELEKCGLAAYQAQTLKLAAGTRNLFELAIAVDYAIASDQNMERFIADADIDELEIIEKFLSIDKLEVNNERDQKSQERVERLKERIAKAKLTGKGPLHVFELAKAVKREAEYKALYKVYSKMTHATAWAILGGCSWDNMALWLLLQANGYAAECVRKIAEKSRLSENTNVPTL